MRYCMTLDFKGYWKYNKSKLKVQFWPVAFLILLEVQGVIQYLIEKVHKIVVCWIACPFSNLVLESQLTLKAVHCQPSPMIVVRGSTLAWTLVRYFIMRQVKFNRLLWSNEQVQGIFWYLEPSFDWGPQKLENRANFIMSIFEPRNKSRVDF